MTEPTPETPELDEGQQDYEALFGRQEEWHQSATEPEEPDEDEALYRALFGA